MIESPKVQIFILTRNRPEYIIECLKSALAQTYADFEVIVSDNSTNDATEKLLTRFSGTPKYTYRKRQKSFSVYEHFNLCLSEGTEDYIMLFHDDDTLIPDALKQMVIVLQNKPDVSAVSCNSSFINSAGKKIGIFNRSLVKDAVFSNPKDLVLHFFSIPMRVTPFSSYLYRRSCLNNLGLSYKEGRKHADVSFIIKVALRGKIYWIAQELINYRTHGENDSGIFDIKAILSLCRFLKKMNFISNALISEFKAQSILIWQKHKLVGKVSTTSPQFDLVLKKHALFYLIKHPTLLFDYFLRFIKFGKTASELPQNKT